MSRSQRFLGGVGMGYLYQATVMVVGLWLTPFLLGQVGQHDYGLWLVGLQVLTYLNLVDFGVIAMLPREVAYATGRDKENNGAAELPDILARTTGVMLLQWPVVLLAAFLMWNFLPAHWERLRPALGIVLGSFALLFPFRMFSATLQGLQDLQFVGRTHMAGWFIGTGVSIGTVLAGWHLYGLAVGWAAMQASMSMLAAWRIFTKHRHILPPRLQSVSGPVLREYMTRGTWVSLSQISQVLLNGSDLIVLGRILGPVAVVPYSCTGKLVSVLANQPQLLMQAAAPGLSQVKTGARERIIPVSMALTQAMLLISGGVVCVVLACNAAFVRWWVGAEQYAGFLLTALIAGNMILRHWNTTTVYTIFAFGRERRMWVVGFCDGVFTLTACFVLVSFLGPMGAPIASMMGVCLISIPGNMTALAADAGVPVWALITPIFPWLWRFGLAAAGASAMSLAAPAGSSAPVVGLLAGSAGLLYLALVWPALTRSHLWPYIEPRLQKLRRFGRGGAVAADVSQNG